jgi:hypothetical protein
MIQKQASGKEQNLCGFDLTGLIDTNRAIIG